MRPVETREIERKGVKQRVIVERRGVGKRSTSLQKALEEFEKISDCSRLSTGTGET